MNASQQITRGRRAVAKNGAAAQQPATQRGVLVPCIARLDAGEADDHSTVHPLDPISGLLALKALDFMEQHRCQPGSPDEASTRGGDTRPAMRVL